MTMTTAGKRTAIPLLAALLLAACGKSDESAVPPSPTSSPVPAATTAKPAQSYAAQHLDDYATVALTADLSKADDHEKQLLVKLIQAADVMDEIFWQQT